MNTYDAFLNSDDHEKNGVELDLDGVGKFQIARAGGGNKQYTKRLERILKPHRRAIQTNTLSIEKADALLAQAYAETVVLRWEGVSGRDGESLPHNKENCIQLLIDLPDLFRVIRETADNEALYRATILEDDGGNS